MSAGNVLDPYVHVCTYDAGLGLGLCARVYVCVCELEFVAELLSFCNYDDVIYIRNYFDNVS